MKFHKKNNYFSTIQLLAWFCLCFLISSCQAKIENTKWQSLDDGFAFQEIVPYNTSLAGKLYAFRIDLAHFKLAVMLTKHHSPFFAGIENLVVSHNAVLGVNGGFFSPDLKPLGLRYNQGKMINPVKNISWWGIFIVNGQRAKIIKPSQLSNLRGVDFAIQAGPRLLINGAVPKLKPGNANRTALGIDKKDNIIIVATDNLALATKDLAIIMRDQLGCTDAINLDGGNSTQLYARINNNFFKITSLAPVTDAVLVMRR